MHTKGSTFSLTKRIETVNFTGLTRGGGGKGRYSLIWTIRGRHAGQGKVFGFSDLNRVFNIMIVCPKQGM